MFQRCVRLALQKERPPEVVVDTPEVRTCLLGLTEITNAIRDSVLLYVLLYEKGTQEIRGFLIVWVLFQSSLKMCTRLAAVPHADVRFPEFALQAWQVWLGHCRLLERLDG